MSFIRLSHPLSLEKYKLRIYFEPYFLYVLHFMIFILNLIEWDSESKLFRLYLEMKEFFLFIYGENKYEKNKEFSAN